jgi:hypothetical protein
MKANHNFCPSFLWRISIIFLLTTAVLCSCSRETFDESQEDIVHFVFVSDSHYGLTRTFNGATCTTEEVNKAMLQVINSLPGANLPNDKGVGDGNIINGIEMIINGGDITNRQEAGIQSATVSWNQFETNFINKITTKTKTGKSTELFVLPGNHDVSNAIGYYKPMSPLTDASAMAGIYNLMFRSATPKTAGNYNYTTDKINLAIERFGICIFFVNIWPGAAEREWISNHLKTLPSGRPAIIFTHDEPDIDVGHLTNPIPPHAINSTYENLLPDMPSTSGSPIGVRRAFAQFISTHSAIKAYFHGDVNYNEFYEFTGPDNNVRLPTFRVDSPMKGKFSAGNQSFLSFLLISINPFTMDMTVRECFWALNTTGSIEWGKTKTINLKK